MGKKRSREQDGLSGGSSDKAADKMDEDSSDEEVAALQPPLNQKAYVY